MSSPLHLSHHAAEFKKPNILSQIEEVQKSYPVYRKIRGDGNCFYRAVGFLWLEQMIIKGIKKSEKHTFSKSRIFKVVQILSNLSNFSKYQICFFQNVEEVRAILCQHNLIEKHQQFFIKLIVHVLSKVLRKIENGEGARKIMKYLTSKVNKNMLFDMAMIFLMRNKTHNSYLEFRNDKENEGFKIQGFHEKNILIFGQDVLLLKILLNRI